MGRRWGLLVAGLVGMAIGIVGSVGVVAAMRYLDGFVYSKTEPGAARWTCDEAKVVAVAVLENGAVTVYVSIDDPAERTWRLAKTDYSSPVDLVPIQHRYAPAVIRTGDLDGGPVRQIRVRPAGVTQWCDGTVSLS